MRIRILMLLIILAWPCRSSARDYMVELFEEHYREQMIVGGGESKIYHTWQVKTVYGDKLLVLVGNDHRYREWLRQSSANHKLYLVKIPDGGDERFKYDRAVLVDVQQVHAVWEKRWSCTGCRHGSPPYQPPPETVAAGTGS